MLQLERNREGVGSDVEASLSDRNSGFGKNLFQALISIITGVALSVLSIGYGMGQYSAGKTFFVASLSAGGGMVSSIALSYLLFMMIRER